MVRQSQNKCWTRVKLCLDCVIMQDPKSREKYINFLAGCIGGIVSVSVCNPLDIARTRLNAMSSPNHDRNRYTHLSQALRTIYQEEGVRGFYTSYKTNVIAISLFHSIFFPLYEYLKQSCIQKGYSQIQTSLISSTTAGGICNFLTNPIWVIRTRLMIQHLHPNSMQYVSTNPLQIMSEIIQKEGYGGLMKGVVPSMLSVINAAIYFTLYQHMKPKLRMIGLQDPSTPVSATKGVFVSAVIAKAISSTITYPLIAVRTILHDARETKRIGFLQTVRSIWKLNGVEGFYRGLKPDLIRIIPANAILFLSYEEAKKYLQS